MVGKGANPQVVVERVDAAPAKPKALFAAQAAGDAPARTDTL